MSKIKKFAIISSLSGVGLLSPVLSTGCSNNDKTLVVCFSCTGHTIDVANKIVNNLDCSLFQIEPTVAYNPETDFGPDGRANKEQSGELPAPEIKNSIKDFKSYSTFFFGYPIWAGTLPKIYYTLCSAYDFTNKTIIPFCTSTETPIDTSVAELKELEPKANFLTGKQFLDSALPTQEEVNEWIKTLNL